MEVGKVRCHFICAEWPRTKGPHKTPFKLHEFLTAVFLAKGTARDISLVIRIAPVVCSDIAVRSTVIASFFVFFPPHNHSASLWGAGVGGRQDVPLACKLIIWEQETQWAETGGVLKGALLTWALGGDQRV